MVHNCAVSQTTAIYKKLRNSGSRMQTQRPVRRSDVTVVNMGTKLPLRLPNGAALHVLNQTAQANWDLCDGEHTEEQMAQELQARFRIAPGRDIEGDVQRSLHLFAEQRLLVGQ
jgi:hypothetical protein